MKVTFVMRGDSIACFSCSPKSAICSFTSLGSRTVTDSGLLVSVSFVDVYHTPVIPLKPSGGLRVTTTSYAASGTLLMRMSCVAGRYSARTLSDFPASALRVALSCLSLEISPSANVTVNGSCGIAGSKISHQYCSRCFFGVATITYEVVGAMPPMVMVPLGVSRCCFSITTFLISPAPIVKGTVLICWVLRLYTEMTYCPGSTQ